MKALEYLKFFYTMFVDSALGVPLNRPTKDPIITPSLLLEEYKNLESPIIEFAGLISLRKKYLEINSVVRSHFPLPF